MKKIILIVGILLGLLAISKSQTNLVTAFNSTHSGRNISITASKTFKEKHEIGGGLRLNINRLAHPDDQFNVYKKRLFATKPIHYFGIEGFYHRYIFNKLEHISPFIFYDFQVSYSTTRNHYYSPYTYDTNGDVLYKEHVRFFGPFTWVEQNIGIGFKANLSSGWYIQQKIGFGTDFILGYDDVILPKIFNWFAWEFGYLINVGIGYRFGKQKKTKSP